MKNAILIFAMSVFCMCISLQAESTKKFGEVGTDDAFSEKEGSGGTEVNAENKGDDKLKKNPVEWKLNLKYADNAERMLKYYEKKKDAARIRLYKMKVAGFKMRAQAYKIGNMKLYKDSEYLIKGKPIPKPPAPPKKEGEGK